MEATSTINLQAMTQSEVAHVDRHNNRENDHYSNDQIVADDLELNTYISMHDENALLERQYGSYLDDRNKKLEHDYDVGKISTQQYTSRKQNVQEYINGANGSKQKKAYTDAVMTVGSVDMLPEMLDQMGFAYQVDKVGKGKDEHNRYTLIDPIQRKKWSSFWADVYGKTANDIDVSMDGLSVISLSVHMDEGGMPHGHLNAINEGVTASGKPSTTLNSALKKAYGNKDGRLNLKQFRVDYDQRLIENFNAVAKDYGYDIKLSLVRTGKTGHKSMKDYKTGKKHEEDVKRQQDAQQAQLDMREKQLLQSETEFEYEKIGQEEEYDQRMKQVKRRERDNAERESKLNMREQELNRRELEQQYAEQKVREFADMAGIPNNHGDNVFDTIIKYMRNIKNALLFRNRHRIQERKNDIVRSVKNQSSAHIDPKNASRSNLKSIKHNDNNLEL
ncbi:hypothetical protein [Liquorilactobacillus satsumensis]|uniref:hypothetical protein n=1 Tax=Liquorilactobacillus satsumensis TaxID=259059 RepID=UPI0039E7708D